MPLALLSMHNTTKDVSKSLKEYNMKNVRFYRNKPFKKNIKRITEDNIKKQQYDDWNIRLTFYNHRKKEIIQKLTIHPLVYGTAIGYCAVKWLIHHIERQ